MICVGAPLPAVERFSRDSMQMAGRQLHRAVSDEARSWCEVEERVETGRAHTKILELAAEERSDLIVIGSRARGPLGSVLFGSTSQHVVRAATCPVLTVRPPRKESEPRVAGSGAPALARNTERP